MKYKHIGNVYSIYQLALRMRLKHRGNRKLKQNWAFSMTKFLYIVTGPAHYKQVGED